MCLYLEHHQPEKHQEQWPCIDQPFQAHGTLASSQSIVWSVMELAGQRSTRSYRSDSLRWIGCGYSKLSMHFLLLVSPTSKPEKKEKHDSRYKIVNFSQHRHIKNCMNWTLSLTHPPHLSQRYTLHELSTAIVIHDQNACWIMDWLECLSGLIKDQILHVQQWSLAFFNTKQNRVCLIEVDYFFGQQTVRVDMQLEKLLLSKWSESTNLAQLMTDDTQTWPRESYAANSVACRCVRSPIAFYMHSCLMWYETGDVTRSGCCTPWRWSVGITKNCMTGLGCGDRGIRVVNLVAYCRWQVFWTGLVLALWRYHR